MIERKNCPAAIVANVGVCAVAGIKNTNLSTYKKLNMKTKLKIHTSPGHCANLVLATVAALKKLFTKPKSTEAVLKSNLKKEMALSDEEYAISLLEDVDVKAMYWYNKEYVTGHKLIEILTKERRDWISEGGTVGTIDVVFKGRKDQLEHQNQNS